ncbi:MAG TPA: PspC domain-containing protein [Acidimicrobiales bacterium]|nr:PspC domain-containing protein [Acidimicrobiales bacterium]
MEHSAPTAPTLTLPPTWSTDEKDPEPEPGQVPGPGEAASPRDGEAVPPPSDEDGPGGTPPWGAPPPPPPLPPTPPPPPPPAAGAERRTLRRHSGARVFGGVAAGLADYLDIDVAVIRIAFVVLAFLGGSGILLYLAGWLLIPADDTDRAVAHQWLQPRNRPRSIVVTVLAGVLILVALTNLFSSGPWWPRWDHGVGGLGFFWALLALVLAAGLLVTAGRRRGSLLRWLVVTSLVSLLAVATVAVATVFSVEALSGVPLRGGIGDAQWRPASISQVDQRYRLAMGNMVVDLRAVDFTSGTTRITATVGIGHLLVEVPPGPTVDVTAHSGLGDVQLFGQDAGGLGTRRSLQVAGSSARGGTAHIRLDAETGVGQVQVVRSPAWSTAGVPAPTPPPVPPAPS